MTATLLRRARLFGVTGQPTDVPRDVLVVDGRIRSLNAQRHDLAGIADVDFVDLDGRHVGPGLWDAHAHVGQWALVASRLHVSAAHSAAETAAMVRAHLEAHPLAPGRVLVGQGFRDALWPDLPTAELLEFGDVPVALISGDVHTLWSNRTTLRMYGLPDTDWLLREQPAYDLGVRISELTDQALDAAVAASAVAAAARGVVGVVDFDFNDAVTAWQRRFAGGFRGLRVRANVYPEHLGSAIEKGIRTGVAVDGGGLFVGGEFKLFTDGSLNTRSAWCDDAYVGLTGEGAHGHAVYTPEELLEVAGAAVAVGLIPAIHAIGDRATSVALDTFRALALPDGSERGSIQHAQLVRDSDIARFAQLGVRASVQPEHAMDDRDVADHFWAGQTDRAFPLRALLDAGAELEFGSDAPVAPLDPWVTIAAAVTRSRDGLPAWHPEQRITAAEALRASWGRGVTELQTGGVADLVVTEIDPLTAPGDALRTMPVWGTMLEGVWTYRAG